MTNAGYSGTPLARKLGVREGARVAILGAPGRAIELLAPVPDGVSIIRTLAPVDLVLFFTTERAELTKRIPQLGEAVFPNGACWIAWPKRSSKVPTDVTEDVVRVVALPLGLVDNKVCAIDEIWSGLRLVWRKEMRHNM